jgi:ATP-dependent helicase/nuclease subunit A
MKLALNRSGSLWNAIQEQKDLKKTVTWLHQAIEKSRTEKPFDFFDDALNNICPFDGASSGWKAFTTCLGADSIDPLDEFLSYCLSKEEDGIFSLEEMVAVFEASTIEIKRDTEDGDKDGANQVRIMTVHASKGMEAPIVFLPDTMSVPNRGKIDALQWIKSRKDKADIPLWAAKSANGCTLYQSLKDESYNRQIAEHMRLLYVALTRPKDRLYIMGESKKETLDDNCWYKLVRDAFAHLPHAEISGGLRIESAQSEPVKEEEQRKPSNMEESQLPQWVFERAEDDRIERYKVIQPSRLLLGDEAVLSPLFDDGTTPINRFLRGNLTHKLFQILPDLPQSSRESAARKFLNRMGADLSETIRENIISETIAILNDSVFAEVFGENSLAEVPISGDMGDGRMISGQIDRLVIGHNKILIVDFKTNRPSPPSENGIPEAYINQMKAYKTALSRIFEGKEVLCALLWTDKPLLMPVSV